MRSPLHIVSHLISSQKTMNNPGAAMLVNSFGHMSTVLIKQVDDHGLYFYSRTNSAKFEGVGAANGHFSLSLYCDTLKTSVFAYGAIIENRDDIYFKKRPYLSRLGAQIFAPGRTLRLFSVAYRLLKGVVTNVPGDIPEYFRQYYLLVNVMEICTQMPGRFNYREVYEIQPSGEYICTVVEP